MLKTFTFNEKAAVEAILYLATRSKDPTFHHISKLLYFADLCHLERYGRFICGDRYIAMRHGPVPSGVYEMLNSAKYTLTYLQFPKAEGAFDVKDGRKVIPLRQPDIEWLSDSDIECLDESIAENDHLSFRALTEKSHDLAWNSANENGEISLEAIVNQVGNPQGLLEYLQDPHP